MPHVSPHTANVLIFTCIDGRLEPSVTALIESFDGGAFHVALAGGGAVFTTEPDRTVAMKQIHAAFAINHVTDIYLQSHMSCGAYKLAGVTFDSLTAEASRLYSDLDLASKFVKQALIDAGASSKEATIHTQVVELDGQAVPRP